jgi:two-component system invasion response regulator UvrY
MDHTTILIVDDHTLIRESWKHILNSDPRLTVIGSCGNAEDGIETAKKLKPDVVLMDINLPGMNGIQGTELIRRFSPASKIIGVSYYTQPSYARKMISVGAVGYVTKNSGKEELTKAIEEVRKGKRYICEEIKNIMVEESMTNKDSSHGFNSLSHREIEIIDFISSGLSSKEIASKLFISVKTVEVHRYNILRKLNLKNTAALVSFIHTNKV